MMKITNQEYLSFKVVYLDVVNLLECEHCLKDAQNWLLQNLQKNNHAKTELSVPGSP